MEGVRPGPAVERLGFTQKQKGQVVCTLAPFADWYVQAKSLAYSFTTGKVCTFPLRSTLSQ